MEETSWMIDPVKTSYRESIAMESIVGVVALWIIREIAGFILKTKLEPHKQTVNRLMNGKLLFVVMDLLFLCYSLWYALFLLNSSEAATKRDVLTGLGLALFVTLQAVNLFDDLVQWVRRYKELSREHEEKLPVLGHLEK
jgi:hypothetical protein